MNKSLGRRVFMRRGLRLAAFSGFAGGSFLLGKGLAGKLDPVSYRFSIVFPPGLSKENSLSKMNEIFPQSRAGLVDKYYELLGLVWGKKTLLTENSHILELTFKNEKVYQNWERDLSSSDSYRADLLKNLGFRFETRKIG